MRVTFAQPAKAARNHLLARLIDDPVLLAKLVGRLDAAERRLARFPELGRPGRQPGTRELVISGTPFMFIYRIDPSAVVILDIRHTARKP